MNELSRGERDDLARCEAVVERGLITFIEVGSALQEIKERRLYRAEFGTFDEYCRDRWGISRIHAHRLIEASSVAENLLPVGNIPTSERQARPLASLDPDEQREAWTRAVETAPNGKPTGEHVQTVVAELFPRDGAAPRGWTESELARKAAVEAGRSVTARIHADARLIEWAEAEGLYVRIDRRGEWGNPHEVGRHGTRDEVIRAYEAHLIGEPGLRRRLAELRGKVLGCWCYPEPCHGDVLIRHAYGETVLDGATAGIRDPAAGCRAIHGDSRLMLATLDAGSDHSCLTSPPYFGQRDYGVEGQIGLERTVKEYIANLVEVFHEVKRILRPDGTLFIVIGDTYRHGSLLGIPDRVARALVRDGWRWRDRIVWAKAEMDGDELRGSCMPGSQEDRCTSAYEVVLHLDRGKGSYFDIYGQLAISGAKPRNVWRINTESNPLRHFALMPRELAERCIRLGTSDRGCCPACGSPWRRVVEKERIPTRPGLNSKINRASSHEDSPYHGHHGIVIGNRDRNRHTTVYRTVGWEPGCGCGLDRTVPCRVLDPFGGLSTTAVVAASLGRVGITIELNPEYHADALRRIGDPGIGPAGCAGREARS
jgi:DNA modification methylase